MNHVPKFSNWLLDEFSRDRSCPCPEFEQNWIGTHKFWLDEFSINGSSPYPGDLPIRVNDLFRNHWTGWDWVGSEQTWIFRESLLDSWTFWFRLFKLKVEFEKFDLSDSVSRSFCFSRISFTIFFISKTVGKIRDLIWWFSSFSKSESELHSDVADSPLSSSSPK